MHYIGEWSNPAVVGECMPPAHGFFVEKISNSRAVLFGGCGSMNDVKNDVYLLRLSVNNIVS